MVTFIVFVVYKFLYFGIFSLNTTVNFSYDDKFTRLTEIRSGFLTFSLKKVKM
jgi:hypothetical protein